MPGPRYEAEIEKFNQKFGLDGFSVIDHYEDKKKIRNLNKFLFNARYKDEALKLYIDTLVDALTYKFESITKLEAGKDYKVTEVSVGEFIVGYEKLMQAKYLDEVEKGNTLKRNHFEGATFNQIAATVWSRVKHYEKTQDQILQDKIRSGEMTVDKIKAITDPAIERILATKPPENDYDTRWKLSESQLLDFTNLNIATRAIESIVSHRTTWQKINPLRWWRNHQENKLMRYLQETKANINNRSNNGNGELAKIYRSAETTKLIGDNGEAKLRAFNKAFKIEDLEEKVEMINSEKPSVNEEVINNNQEDKVPMQIENLEETTKETEISPKITTEPVITDNVKKIT